MIITFLIVFAIIYWRWEVKQEKQRAEDLNNHNEMMIRMTELIESNQPEIRDASDPMFTYRAMSWCEEQNKKDEMRKLNSEKKETPSETIKVQATTVIKTMTASEELKQLGLRSDPAVEKMSFGQRRAEYTRRFNALSDDQKAYVKKLKDLYIAH